MAAGHGPYKEKGGQAVYNIIGLMCAIEFIEQNARAGLRVADVAAASYLSASHLQRMFADVFHCSVGGYITKRKLCQAAAELIGGGRPITDLALDYGYGSTESFSRAFKRQFLKTPSAFRRENRFSQLHPKLLFSDEMMKGRYSMTRIFDQTEISAKIMAAKGTYIISADIDHLKQINDTLGHDAGDVALAETAARIEKSIGENAEFYRIGGDWFVILTGSASLEDAERIAKGILSFSGDEVKSGGSTFRFSLSLGIIRVPADIRDARTAIEQSDAAMVEAKRNGRSTYYVVE